MKHPEHSVSPFYDLEFAQQIRKKSGQLVPRGIERGPFHHLVDLRDHDAGGMSWGVTDRDGVVIAQFDFRADAEKFCEFFEGH